MADWRAVFNFPIFFTAVYRDNSALLQGDAVNTLLVGDGSPDMMLGKDIVTRYIYGKRPISRTTVSSLIKMGEDTLVDRVSKSGIQDVIMGARCLSRLMQSEHLDIPAYAKASIEEIAFDKEPYRYIARCFLQAVGCPKEALAPITKEMIESILGYRIDHFPVVGPSTLPEGFSETDEPQDASTHAERPNQEAETHAGVEMTAYHVISLDYETERERIKQHLEEGKNPEFKRQFSTDDIFMSLEAIRQSAKTWMIIFRGTPSGLADILVHRIKEKQCTQISLICRARNQYSIRKLRTCLGNFAHYFLKVDGLMTFAYGFEKVLRAEEFQITLIYSVSTFTKEDERIEQIAHDEYFMPLNPWDQYAGRVPEFLSPLEEVREASGDLKK